MRDFPEYNGPMYLWLRVEAIPGAKGAIESIFQNRTIALATNAADSDEEDIWKALRRVGLDVLFDRVYCFQNIGYKKPSPEFFRYILNDLRISADDVIMVGDDLVSDVLAANRSGIFGIWFNERSNERIVCELYETINMFSELPEVVSRRDVSVFKH